MKKRTLHHIWRYSRKVHPVFFLIPALVFTVICVKALQHNNLAMGRLRQAVFTADKENGDVEGALRALRVHVYSHMNTSLDTGHNGPHPPIQLKYTYERLQAEQQKQLSANNSSLYNKALEQCNTEGHTVSAEDTIACIENKSAAQGVQLAEVPDALYKFDFVAAKWSPDLAGWSLVAAVLCSLACIGSIIYRVAMKRYLKARSTA
jgi:hypothetical protein